MVHRKSQCLKCNYEKTCGGLNFEQRNFTDCDVMELSEFIRLKTSQKNDLQVNVDAAKNEANEYILKKQEKLLELINRDPRIDWKTRDIKMENSKKYNILIRLTPRHFDQERNLPQNFGPRNPSPQYLGQQSVSPKNFGPRNPCPQNPGPQNLGPQNPCPQYVRQQNLGPQYVGPQNVGPRNLCLRNPGHQNLGPRNLCLRNPGQQNLGPQNPRPQYARQQNLGQQHDGPHNLSPQNFDSNNHGPPSQSPNNCGPSNIVINTNQPNYAPQNNAPPDDQYLEQSGFVVSQTANTPSAPYMPHDDLPFITKLPKEIECHQGESLEIILEVK